MPNKQTVTKITFPTERRVGRYYGPKSKSIVVNGDRIGSIQTKHRYSDGDEWFWYANWNGKYENTASRAVSLKEAKAEVKAWVAEAVKNA